MNEPPTQHIEAAKHRLTDLAGLAAKTEETERRILAAAEKRLEEVCADLDKLRPRALIDKGAGERYQELTHERGDLEHVIAQARAVLG